MLFSHHIEFPDPVGSAKDPQESVLGGLAWHGGKKGERKITKERIIEKKTFEMGFGNR